MNEEKMSLRKIISNKKNVPLLVIASAFLCLVILTGAESLTAFTIIPMSSSDVVINPPLPYTTDSITCEFFVSLTYPEDYDDYKIVWKKNGDEQPEFENSSIIYSNKTLRDEVWICEVTIYKDEEQIEQDEGSVTIANSPPSSPKVYDLNGNEISEGFSLIEDQEVQLIFNTTDPDGDVLRYSFEEQVSFCTVLDQDTGLFSCTVRHEHVSISGTSAPGPEENKTVQIGLQASERFGQDRLSVVRDFEFVLVPVNDQAEFASDPPIPDKTIFAQSGWSYTIEGFDEELDYPLNFTKSHDPHLDLIFADQTDTSAVLTFTYGQPENHHSGNWTVTIYVTDNGSSKLPPTSHTFNLEVIRTNFIPVFITDFSNISGKQGEPFELLLEAYDEDEEDFITFHIERDPEGNEFCTPEIFPWEINKTLSHHHSNASALIKVDNLTNDHIVCREVKLIVMDDTLAENVVKVKFDLENINDAPVIHELSFYEENIGGQTNISNLVVSQYSSSSYYRVNATDPDQLTYDAENTGLLMYTTNDSRFKIDNLTGVVNLSFSSSEILGVHNVLITVTDNCQDNPLNDSRIMTVEVVENQPPLLEVPGAKEFSQNDDIIIKFNTTEPDGESTYLVFESNNERFNKNIYEISHDVYSYEIDGVANVTTWYLNLSKWIENKTLSHPENSRPLKSLYANELVGPHNLTVKVFDENNAFDEVDSVRTIIFYVLNENDPPFFDMIERNNVSDGEQVTFPPIVVDSMFSRTFYATDFDMFLPLDLFSGIYPYNETETYYESLSFEVFGHSNLTNINFIKQNEYSATLLFRPTKQGSNFINISVIDSHGARENLTIEFLVYNSTDPPQVEEVSPYFDGYYTNTSFINTTEVSSPQEDLLWVENGTLTFAADIWFAPEIIAEVSEPNYLDIEWIVNGKSAYNITNINFEDDIKTESAFEHYFDFFSSGINEIKMIATDAVGSFVEWIWYVDVENVNRPPIFCPDTLNDIIFSGSTTLNYYLGYLAQQQRFYNPDDDSENTGPDSFYPCNTTRSLEVLQDLRELSSMSFRYELVRGHCDADFIFEGTTLTIIGHDVGFCEVKFIGEDDYGEEAISNTVFVEILEAMSDEQDQDRVITEIERVTIPIEEEVDSPKPAQIIFPGDVVIYSNQTVKVPINIRNTWTDDLRRISLSANVLNESENNDYEEIDISLSIEEINLLRVNQEEEVVITLTNYRRPVPLKINVFAEVADPHFTDSDIIIIAGLEMAGDDPQSVRSLVTYARDLLTTSPECAELNDLLNNAQRALDQGQVDDALRMIDAAINGCRYLLSQEEELRREQPGMLRSGLDFTTEYLMEIVVGSIALIFVAIVFYVLAFIRMSLKNK